MSDLPSPTPQPSGSADDLSKKSADYQEGFRAGVQYMNRMDDEAAVMDRILGSKTDEDLSPRQLKMWEGVQARAKPPSQPAESKPAPRDEESTAGYLRRIEEFEAASRQSKRMIGPGSPAPAPAGDAAGVTVGPGVDPESPAEKLAKKFHRLYETLAPSFGYATRSESAKPWSEVPENNRRLMVAVCAQILKDFDAAPAPAPAGDAAARKLGMFISDRCGFCTEYGEKAEPFLCVECKERMQPYVARATADLRGEVERLQQAKDAAEKRLAEADLCDICGGLPLESRRQCACNGTGKLSIAITSIRQALFDTEKQLAAASVERDAMRSALETLRNTHLRYIINWDEDDERWDDPGECGKDALRIVDEALAPPEPAKPD